jgi:hypothetical protein
MATITPLRRGPFRLGGRRAKIRRYASIRPNFADFSEPKSPIRVLQGAESVGEYRSEKE